MDVQPNSHRVDNEPRDAGPERTSAGGNASHASFQTHPENEGVHGPKGKNRNRTGG